MQFWIERSQTKRGYEMGNIASILRSEITNNYIPTVIELAV